jgi:hypothetical protein
MFQSSNFMLLLDLQLPSELFCPLGWLSSRWAYLISSLACEESTYKVFPYFSSNQTIVDFFYNLVGLD